jgi:phage gp16-like protein
VNTQRNTRNAELAKIHVAKRDLRMEDDAYRDMLWTVARVRSAKDLDAGGRAKVLDHLKACGFAPKRGKPHAGQPHNLKSQERGGQLGKIEAMLAAAGRPWAYADGMAKKMCNVDAIAFCNAEQLQKIIAALVYDAARRARRA